MNKLTHNEKLIGILVSIILIIVGIILTGRISTSKKDDSVEYQTALQITDSETFDYAVDTSVGKILVEGRLEAIKPFHFENDVYVLFKGNQHTEYDCLFYRVDKEELRMYTTTSTDSDGNTTTDTYWSWDVIDKKLYHNNVKLYNKIINTAVIEFDGLKWQKMKTEEEAWDIRYVYYGVMDKVDGTLAAFTRDGKFSSIVNQNKSTINFYVDKNIDAVLSKVTKASTIPIILVWLVIVLFGGIVIYILYSRECGWAEDKPMSIAELGKKIRMRQSKGIEKDYQDMLKRQMNNF